MTVRASVRPASPFRLSGRGGLDGITRLRGKVLERAVWVGDGDNLDDVAVVRVAQPAADRVVLGARAMSTAVAQEALKRSRAALGIDKDLHRFYRCFASDRLIGRSLRARPYLRPAGRPDRFEVLTFAICEQLIEYKRALTIERRLLAEHGRICPAWDGTATLRALPSAATVAALPAARLEACGLTARRATALIAAAHAIASGRIDLDARSEQELGWRQLSRIVGIGRWTVEVLALHGQGRYDQLPAGDLAYLKFGGRMLRPQLGPSARATEEEVRELMAPYIEAGWGGVAGLHALGSGGSVGGSTLRFSA